MPGSDDGLFRVATIRHRRNMNLTRTDAMGRMSQRQAQTATSNETLNHRDRETASSVVLRRLRKRRGECVACGRRTHQQSLLSDQKTGSSFEHLIPLTVEGTVANGRCIECNPKPEDKRRLKEEQKQQQQQWNDGDDQQANKSDLKAHRSPDDTATPSRSRSKSTSSKTSSSKRDLLSSSKSRSKRDRSSSQRPRRSRSAVPQRLTAQAAKDLAGGDGRRSQSRVIEMGGASSREHHQDRQHSNNQLRTRQSSPERVVEQTKEVPSADNESQVHKQPDQTVFSEKPKEIGIEEEVDRRLSIGGYSSTSDLSTLGQESVISTGVTLKRIRERNGLCSECGNRTHTFVRDDMGVQTKHPRTVEGLVHRGRCLRCYPLPNPGPKRPQPDTPTEPENIRSKSSSPKPRTEPMAPPAPSEPTDKPKSILRRSSSYNSKGSAGSSKSGKSSKKSVTIVHDDSSIGSMSKYNDDNEDDDEPNAPLDTDAQRSFRSAGNKSSSKSTRSLFEPKDDKISSSSPNRTPAGRNRKRKGRSRTAQKETKAALDRLNAINECSNKGGAALVDIVATLRQHPNIEEVQICGASMLYERSKTEAVVLGRSGGIPTILDAMEKHKNSTKLHVICCKLIRTLADDGEYNGKVLAKHGAFTLVCDTMERHQNDMSIQSCGCSALAALAESRHLDGIPFDNARVLGALVEAVSAFPEQEDVLRRVYNALKAYGYNPMKVLMRWQDEKERRRLIATSEY